MICSSHHGCIRIFSIQDSEMFQPSDTSWSSKTMAEGTVERSQRMAGSPTSPDRAGRTPRSTPPLLRGVVGVAARTDKIERLERGLMGVDLVAQEQQRVGQALLGLLL